MFLIGMEEGVFPSEMSKYSEADLEEERRLAYVGITRAKKELYISNSVTRMLYGRTQRNEPSRFLREIEPEYIEETRSPVLEQRSRMGGWGDSYSDTVPGGHPVTPGPPVTAAALRRRLRAARERLEQPQRLPEPGIQRGRKPWFGSSYGGRSHLPPALAATTATALAQPTAEAADLAPHILADKCDKKHCKANSLYSILP